MANRLPADGNWPAVNAAVTRLRSEQHLTIADLSRKSGISETTIRYMRAPEQRQLSTLTSLCAAFEVRHDYLTDVLNGAADPVGDAQRLTPAGLMAEVLGRLDRIESRLESIRETAVEIAGERRKDLRDLREEIERHTHTTRDISLVSDLQEWMTQ